MSLQSALFRRETSVEETSFEDGSSSSFYFSISEEKRGGEDDEQETRQEETHGTETSPRTRGAVHDI
jgi:hypothetical protein